MLSQFFVHWLLHGLRFCWTRFHLDRKMREIHGLNYIISNEWKEIEREIER